jgi:hypothetical protein
MIEELRGCKGGGAYCAYCRIVSDVDTSKSMKISDLWKLSCGRRHERHDDTNDGFRSGFQISRFRQGNASYGSK